MGRALFASPPMHAAAPVLSLRPPPSFSNAAASATGVSTQPSEKEPLASAVFTVANDELLDDFRAGAVAG